MRGRKAAVCESSCGSLAALRILPTVFKEQYYPWAATSALRDWAHPCHICIGTGLTPATSAPGLGSPLLWHIPVPTAASAPAHAHVAYPGPVPYTAHHSLEQSPAAAARARLRTAAPPHAAVHGAVNGSDEVHGCNCLALSCTSSCATPSPATPCTKTRSRRSRSAALSLSSSLPQGCDPPGRKQAQAEPGRARSTLASAARRARGGRYSGLLWLPARRVGRHQCAQRRGGRAACSTARTSSILAASTTARRSRWPGVVSARLPTCPMFDVLRPRMLVCSVLREGAAAHKSTSTSISAHSRA